MRELLVRTTLITRKIDKLIKIIYMFAQVSRNYKQNFKDKLKKSRFKDGA